VDAELFVGVVLLPLVAGLIATVIVGPRRIGPWLRASLAGLIAVLFVNTVGHHLFVSIAGALLGAGLYLGAEAVIRRSLRLRDSLLERS
jgi:hypothetical protein